MSNVFAFSILKQCRIRTLSATVNHEINQHAMLPSIFFSDRQMVVGSISFWGLNLGTPS